MQKIILLFINCQKIYNCNRDILIQNILRSVDYFYYASLVITATLLYNEHEVISYE